MASSTVNPATMMTQHITSDYVSATTPEPDTPGDSGEPSSPAPSTDDAQSKRKRKSWGQAIPDYEKILPPGKRAKTDAEKEQRRCERIMRNRRAAATSRDRKKREFEEMEKKVEDKEAELAWVRQQAQEQMQQILKVAFPDGKLPPALANMDLSFSLPSASPPRQSSLPPTPAYSPIETNPSPQMKRHASPAISVVSLNNTMDPSPTLTPSLFIKNEEPDLDSHYSHNTPQSFNGFPDLSSSNDKLDNMVANAIDNPRPVLDTFANFEGPGLTQYPAVSAGDFEGGLKTDQFEMGQQYSRHPAHGGERHIQYLISQDDLAGMRSPRLPGADLATSASIPGDDGHDLSFDTYFDFPSFEDDVSSSFQDGNSAQTSVMQPAVGALLR